MKQKALFLLGVLTALLSLFGCSGADSAPPSKIPYPTEMPALDPKADIYAQDLAGEDLLRGNEIFSQQFRIPATVSAESLTAENRLALSKDGTYRLVKAMTGTETENFSLVFDFSGTYTDGGDGAFTLSPADSVTAYIDWGAFDASRPGASGVFTGADSLAYSRAFNSQYIGDDAGNNEMYVQINAQEKTFEITGNGSQQDRYTVTNLNTERDGLNIYGVSVLPAGYTEGKLPVVIFSHGFLGNNTIQRDIAYAFAERGIASYCFDFCGGSMTSKSDGSFYDLSMLTEVEDLHAVVDFIRDQPFTDTDNIFIFGESMGGAVGSLVAAQRPAGEIKGLLHFYPAFSISEQTRYMFKTPDLVPERVQTVVGVTVAGKFYTDAWTIDIYPEIAPFKGPVLMFQGTADVIVPPIYVENSVDHYENAELVLYEGQGHGFSREIKLQAMAKMIEFIEKNK